MKRKLSLLVVLFSTLFAMAGRSFNGTEVLYLKASAVDWWQNANAVQKATFDGAEVVVGVADANNSGYVGFTVPAGEYTTVKFSRHETVESDPWNSTGNITIAAEGNCVMTFSQNSSEATWGTYDPGHVEVITYSIKTNWKDGGWGAGFKELTVNDDGSQSMTETYTGNGFNISPSFLGTDWYPVEKLNLVGGVAANDLVTISVNPNATDQANVFTITKISSPEPEPELDPIDVTVRVYTTAGAPKIWWWGGDITAPTMSYDARPSMNKEDETNWYSWTFESVNATSGINYKITATGEKEFTGVKENKCLDANLENLDCSYEPEPEPEPEPETAPDHLYILGNIEGVDWTPGASAEMTKNGDIFTGTYTFTQATSYFAFTTVQGSWDDVNANRYHSSALTAGADPIALIKENGSSTIGQGTYTIIVDWANMTVAAEEVEPEPTLETNVYLAGTFNGWSTTSHNFVRQNLGDEVAYTTITGVSTTGDIEFKVVEGGKWCNAETQNITFESTSVTFLSDDVSGSQVKMTPYAAGDYVVAFNLTTRVLTVTYPTGEKMEEMHEIALAGTFNSWGDEHPAFEKQSLTSYTVTQNLTAGSYEFRVIVDGTWKGANYTITRAACTNVELGADQNFNLTADIDGDYVFDYNPQTQVLTVTYPELPQTLETNVYLAGTFNGWSTESHNFVRKNLGDEVAYTTITGVSTTGDIEFKIVEGSQWCNAETQNITSESTSVTFRSDNSEGYQVKMTPYAAGDYVVAFNLTTRVLTVTYPEGEKMEETHEIALAGTFNSWGDEHPAFEKQSLTSYTVTQNLTAGSYEFRVIVDGTYKGANYTITRAACTNVELGANQNFNLTADIDGDYVFDYNPQIQQLSVTYPEMGYRTIYFVNTPNWENVYAYVYVGETPLQVWPGEQATKEATIINGYNVYSYTFPEIYTTIIFNNGSSGEGNQTWNITVNMETPYVYNNGSYANAAAVKSELTTFRVSLTADGYASFCWDKNWTAPGATVYIAKSREGDAILIEEVVSDVIPAGAGVILKASGAQVTVTATAEDATSLASNILNGTTAEIDRPDGTIYALHYSNDASATVFDQYTGDKIPANKAYLNLGAGAPARLRVAMAGNTTTGMEAAATVNGGVSKRLINGQLIILRDGKMYNVQGVQL